MAVQQIRVLYGSAIKYFCLTVILWTVLADASLSLRRITKPPYGYPCTRDIHCRIPEKYTVLFADFESKCIDGVCDCDESKQYRVFQNGTFNCVKGNFVTIKTDHGKCNTDEPDTCIDGTCDKRLVEKRCFCQDGSVLVGNTCRMAITANYSDDCTVPESGPVPVCDYKKSLYCATSDKKCACLNYTLSKNEESQSETFGQLFHDDVPETCVSAKVYAENHPNETLAGLDEFCGTTEKIPKVCDDETMECKESKCKCKRKFYPVKSNGTCETYQSYMDAHNISSYQVSTGQYCYDNSECITGLVCHKNLCDCPYPCTYNKAKIACDCGAVSATEGATSAILVGIIGGFLIMYFWYRMIRKTVDKGKEKSQQNSSYNDVTSEPLPDDTYNPPSYGISPNGYPSKATYDTNNDDDIPLTDVPPYPPNPSSNVPPNPPTNVPPYPSSNAPPYPPTNVPPYTSTDVPPYPPNPSTDVPPNPSSGAPPYPPNPSTDAPSYPLNPPINTPPYPSTAAPPYNPNYSQPAGPVGFTSNPETTGSAIPPSAPPYGAPSDASMPPPYTPTNQNDKPGADIYNPIIS